MAQRALPVGLRDSTHTKGVQKAKDQETKSPRRRLHRCLTAVALVVILGCTAEPDASVRLGLVLDGSAAENDAARFAAEKAVADVMADGGLDVAGKRVPVELFLSEAVTSPERAVASARRLISEHQIIALVGPSRSRNALAVAPLAEQTQVVVLTPKATHPAVTENRRWVFRLVVTDVQQGRLLAQFARQDLSAQSAGLIYDAADAYGRTVSQAFRDAFESAGGEVVALEAYTTGAQDFNDPLQAMAETQPDVLFLPGYDDTVPLLLRQAAAMQLDTVFLGSDGWTPLTSVDSGIDHTFFSQHWFYDATDTDPRLEAFAEAHIRAFDYEPFDLAALTYDAFGLAFEAISNAQSLDAALVRDHLAQLQDYRGLTGPITYRDSGGDPLKPLLILASTPDGLSLNRSILPAGRWAKSPPPDPAEPNDPPATP